MKILLLFVVIVTLGFVSCKKTEIEENFKYIDFKDLSLNEKNTYWNKKEEGINIFKSGIATFYHKGNFSWEAWYNSGFFYSNRTEYIFIDTVYQKNSIDEQYQYTSANKNGVGSDIYLVYNNDTTITYDVKFDSSIDLKSIIITNNAYAYCSVSFGDSHAKKFEKDDWFKAIFTAYDEGENQVGIKEVYLAKDGNIQKEWKQYDFNFSEKIMYLKITFDSSDVGDYGINTPTYLSIGKIIYE